MSQPDILSYFNVCKKKLNEETFKKNISLENNLSKSVKNLTTIKDINNEQVNSNEDQFNLTSNSLEQSTIRHLEEASPFKVPLTPKVPRSRKKIGNKCVKSEERIDLIDNQESILKWTKRSIDLNESSSEKKKKRLEEEETKKGSSIKKRLFDLDETLLTRIKELDKKTKEPIKLNINLNSPTKRYQEQQERRKRAVELINRSPKKFLENKLSNSPIKSPLKIQLLEGLTLPTKYKKISDYFHCLDSVISLLFNRQEACTFDKIKCGIQKIIKKSFETGHLAQIITIYPEAYSLSYQKKTAIDNLNNLKVTTSESKYYLVINPKINSIKLIPSVLKQRKNEFEDKLLKFAKKAHEKFLLSLNPPIVVLETELTRWHPSFIFPDIPESPLAKEPDSNNKINNIKDFWIKKGVVNQEDESKNEKKIEKIDHNSDKITTGVLKGLSVSFVEKIKNREHVNLVKELTRNPEVEKKLNNMKKLPELVRILHSFFITEKKKAILLTDVIKKCIDSSSSFNSRNCSELIYLTNEFLPDWLLILKTSQGIYVKINRETLINTLFKRLEKATLKIKQT